MVAKRKYTFKSANHACKLKCEQCLAKTRGGKRCKRASCYDEACFQHMKSEKNVVIKTSTIPNAGMGLFATWSPDLGNKADYIDRKKPIFKKDMDVCYYGGEVLTQEELNTRYPGEKLAPYAISVTISGKIFTVDAACIRGAGSMVNDSKTPNQNAKLVHRRVRTSEKDSNGIPMMNGAFQSPSGTWYTIVIQARKGIYHGDEIFASYGKDYWKANNNN